MMKKPTPQAQKLLEQFPAFVVRWGTSRGYNTYGYTTCSLRLLRPNGTQVKAAYCNGGGYDMRGTVLGQFLGGWFTEDLKKLSSSTGSLDRWSHKNCFYGLCFYDPIRKKFRKRYREGFKVWLDGACGWLEMLAILNQFGLTVAHSRINANTDLYTFQPLTKKGR